MKVKHGIKGDVSIGTYLFEAGASFNYSKRYKKEKFSVLIFRDNILDKSIAFALDRQIGYELTGEGKFGVCKPCEGFLEIDITNLNKIDVQKIPSF